MSQRRTLDELDLEALLRGAIASQALASLRADGSVRMLGKLRIESLEPGVTIGLQGAKQRDDLPAAGTEIILSLILGEEAVAIRTGMLAPVEGPDGQPLLRIAWPTGPLEFYQREEVRVAYSDLPPLEATLIHHGRPSRALLLNLTETGMGLGLQELLTFEPMDQVTVETCLPGGTPFRAQGMVRHFQILEDDELPTRVGLILTEIPFEVRGALRNLIHARRMYYTQGMRER